MSDPTAIAIDQGENDATDPRKIVQKGIAAHGYTPFECPIISQITEDLWVGGCRDGLVLPAEINHVVSLYPWEVYETSGETCRSMTQIYMYDSTDQDTGIVDGIAAWVNTLRKDGVVLVHCQAGLNRSNLVAARALILEGMKPAAAISLLREKRSPAVLCNRAFEHWLLAQ